MSGRNRTRARRIQRVSENPDINAPMRHVSSNYVKRLMMEYHDKHVANLAADVKVVSSFAGALMKLLIEKGLLTEQEIADALKPKEADAEPA